MRRLGALLCAAVVAAAALTVVPLSAGRSAYAAAALSGPLHTSGTRILDAAGNPVRLRGLTRDGLERSSTGWNITDDELAHARQWGANIVRVPLSEDYWTQLCPTTSYDGTYRGRIDGVVKSITSRGMVALLELSFNPRFACDPGANSQQKMAAYPGSVLFWADIARRYGGNPLVAFELYNEPNNISDDVWLKGGTVNDFGIFWQAAGMQQLYDSVRGTGATNLVFIGGMGYSSNPPAVVVTGNNIVYGAHVYTCPSAPPPNCTSPHAIDPFGLVWVWSGPADPYDATPLLAGWTAFGARYPLVVTEFGWPSAQDGRFNASAVAGAEQRGWGWIAFAWDGTASGTFGLLANAGPGANYDPSPSGVPVKQGLSIQP
jgi:hypothetical protein